MRIEALQEYYQRRGDLPREGFVQQELPFVIVLDVTGAAVQIEDTRTFEGRLPRGRQFMVPQPPKKTINVATSLLWGNAEYALGVPSKKKLVPDIDKRQKYLVRLAEMHTAFVRAIERLPAAVREDAGVAAVYAFCRHPDLAALARFGKVWQEIVDANPYIGFRLQGDLELVCQRHAVVAALASASSGKDEAVCMVTGERDVIERLHPSIKGVAGAQTSGANIVSFNHEAFNSYNKTQGMNAPIGRRAAFAYTTALNHLLEHDSRHNVQIGAATVVFWANRYTKLEDHFAHIFDEPPPDEPDRNTRAIATWYSTVYNGVVPNMDTAEFYVLGLNPNAGRLAVCFWVKAKVAEFAALIQQHFDDIDIVCAPHVPRHLSVFRLLLSAAVEGRSENIPGNLGGMVMHAILSGGPYPVTLLQGAIRRTRAEGIVTRARAATIKGCLNRAARFANNTEKELHVSLDPDNSNAGYRLGRLFAVLEKIQEQTNLGPATIRSRFYGIASSTPAIIFSKLMRFINPRATQLQHGGKKVEAETLISEILAPLQGFPERLNLDDQGRFAVGYYHQRQAFDGKWAMDSETR